MFDTIEIFSVFGPKYFYLFIHFLGYTIPAGWVIMIATAALHLNSNHFEDPLLFNPWRWKVNI